jgi:hypothetical protein
MNTTITRQLIAENLRVEHTVALFGIQFPLSLEPSIYTITGSMAPAYQGGYWHFYTLSNGGFYMAPHSKRQYQVICDNGFEGQLSADALGITACLYAYSHLSFNDNQKYAEVCAQHYHLLREFMLEHQEAGNILRAID